MKRIIKNPRITEKGNLLSAQNAYLFDAHESATKLGVKNAVFSIYKVKPIKVNLLNIPQKKINNRGKVGTRGGGKKAVVYLREGDKIELV